MRVGERSPDWMKQAQKDKQFLTNQQPSVKLGKRVIKAQPDMARVQSAKNNKGVIPMLVQPQVKPKNPKND